MSNEEYLGSVTGRIGEAIVSFCESRAGGTFYADELRRHVVACVGQTAPGSADRVLRYLRARGVLDYVVLDRRQSLYRVEWVGEAQGLA